MIRPDRARERHIPVKRRSNFFMENSGSAVETGSNEPLI
jgi:hypothetical protein